MCCRLIWRIHPWVCPFCPTSLCDHQVQTTGWVKQVMAMINPGLMQRLYNMVPYIPILKPQTTKPTVRVACIQAGALQEKIQPKHSVASFPDDGISQHMIQASGNDGAGHIGVHLAANTVTPTTKGWGVTNGRCSESGILEHVLDAVEGFNLLWSSSCAGCSAGWAWLLS